MEIRALVVLKGEYHFFVKRHNFASINCCQDSLLILKINLSETVLNAPFNDLGSSPWPDTLATPRSVSSLSHARMNHTVGRTTAETSKPYEFIVVFFYHRGQTS